MPKPPVIDKQDSDKSVIYLSIDHLKQGKYKLRLTLKNKVVKSLVFKRDANKRSY
jgi:hypothetical protein